MRVRLTRRLADQIDGVDLGTHQVGDALEVSQHDAELLIAEGWAVAAPEPCRPLISRMTTAELLREWTAQPHEGHEQRRAEDRFREELRDNRAITISKNQI